MSGLDRAINIFDVIVILGPLFAGVVVPIQIFLIRRTNKGEAVQVEKMAKEKRLEAEIRLVTGPIVLGDNLFMSADLSPMWRNSINRKNDKFSGIKLEIPGRAAV